jgi:signal transduction histidine kinase
VESAVYFAVCEMLTNTAKHSGARQVWVDLGYRDGMIRATVTDDGQGGATLEGGTGLRGLERRIGTFDGVLALSSPPGGPTIVTMEVPCALDSSPKL